MKKLKVGVVGAGGIATARHIPAFQQISSVELTAVTDINLDHAKIVADQFSITHVCENLDAMLEIVDAIVICTPNKFHAPIAIQALNAGVHVLCEKPMALSTEECKAMIEASEKSGKTLLIAYHYRFMKEPQAAKRLIDAGEIGDPLVIRAKMMRRRKVPGWGVFTNKDLQGGGALIDYGCHMLDLALWLAGNRVPTEVNGQTFNALSRSEDLLNEWGSINSATFEVEDHAAAFIRLNNGAVIMLETSWAANIAEDEESLSISGTKGGIEVFPLRVNKQSNGMLVTTTPDFIPEEKTTDLAQAEHFVACCFGEETPISTPKDSMQVSKVIEQIYENSAKSACSKSRK